MIENINGVSLHVSDLGGGTPFVWAHGLMDSIEGEDFTNWIKWSDISSIARLIRYDARGHGESGLSGDPRDYHWSSLAKDMLSLAGVKRLKRFVAGGRSMGCATAIYAALSEPSKIQALVLVNPPTGWNTREAQASMFQKLARLVGTSNARLLPAMLKKTPENQYPDWLVQADPQKIRDYIDLQWNADPKALELVFKGAALCDLPPPDRLNQIDIPTLILAWNKDSSHPLDSALGLHDAIKSSTLEIAEDMASFSRWPERVKTFLESHG